MEENKTKLELKDLNKTCEINDNNDNDDLLTIGIENQEDLRDCLTNIEQELQQISQLTVQDCIDNRDKIADLAEEIEQCDGILKGMENMLVNFLDDLEKISGDMKHLKEQSIEINQQLNNHQRVRAELSQFVDDMVVPHSMIKIITEKDVNSTEFLEQLHELQHKLQFIKTQQFKDAKSVGDVREVVENLKYKALEKIREWLLLRISLFRKPLTNYQIVQNALLKNRQVAYEVKDEYVDTVSKMFFTYFKAYVTRLFKLLLSDKATKSDLLGSDNTVFKQPSTLSNLPNIFSSSNKTQNQQHKTQATVFSLGNRQNALLDDILAPLIVPNVAQENNETFQFESLFRSVQYAIVDHCSREYLFLCDFFLVTEQSAVDLFTHVMGRSIGLLLKSLEERINLNYDAISLFICICFCTKYHQLMIQRNVLAIETYWENIEKMLFDRFELIMKLHNESIRQLDVRKMLVDTRPHYVIRRYAELTSSLLICSDLAYKKINQQLISILSRQQAEIEGLLNRLATQLKTKKERLVFQINNYDVILTVLNEKVVPESKERNSFWELQQLKIASYVEEVLAPYFSSLINFVNECEPLIEQNHSQLLARYEAKVVPIVRTFSAEWRRSIEAINNEILHSFTNLKNAANILQLAFTQFINYYQRLDKVTSHQVFRQCQISGDLVPYQHIAETIKKYKPIF